MNCLSMWDVEKSKEEQTICIQTGSIFFSEKLLQCISYKSELDLSEAADALSSTRAAFKYLETQTPSVSQ